MTQRDEIDIEPIMSDLQEWGLVDRDGTGPDCPVTLTERGLIAWRLLTPLVSSLLDFRACDVA